MALQYYLYLECPLQKDKQFSVFMRQARLRHILTTIDEQSREVSEAGDDPNKLELRLPTRLASAENLPEKLSVGKLREHCSSFDDLALKYCHQCPGNVWEEPMGCHGAIEFPISAAAENWMMNQFDPPEGERGFVPHHLLANRISGERVNSFRDQRDEYERCAFELPNAVVTKFSENGIYFSSSQIIEFIAGCEPTMIPQTLFGFCRDFQMVQGTPEEIRSIYQFLAQESMSGPEEMTKMHGPDWKQHITQNLTFTMTQDESDDPSINQFKAFFYAAWMAFTQDTVLFITSPYSSASPGCK